MGGRRPPARPGSGPGGGAPEPDDDPDDEMPAATDDAIVACPYCGAANTLLLDPSGGRVQQYVEDCQVCCQPWHVRVRYSGDGTASVTLDPADGG